MGINIGIIGFGWISRNVHYPILINNSKVKSISLCDINISKMDLNEFKFNKLYSDPLDMINDDMIDLILISTPNNEHFAQIMGALIKGKMVFCEKPICIKNNELSTLKQLFIKNKNYKLFLGHTNRFRRDVLKLKDMMKEIGFIYKINAKWIRRNGIPGNKWFLNYEESGGGVSIDLGSHMLDLLFWLLEEHDFSNYLSVFNNLFLNKSEKTAQWYQDSNLTENTVLDVEDNYSLFVSLKNSVAISLDVSWASNFENDKTEIEILGEKGIIKLDSLFGFSNNSYSSNSKLTLVHNEKESNEYYFDLTDKRKPYLEMWKYYLDNIDNYETIYEISPTFSALDILINSNNDWRGKKNE